MSIPPYVLGFPQDGSSLGNTRVQIRNNLDGTFQTLAVDHIDNNGSPGSGTPGYHNIIHFQDKGSATPAAIAGVTQMYTNTDSHSIQQTRLVSTAGNTYQQSTMLDAFISRFGDDLSVNVAGWTFLPGGLIMNYGFTPKGISNITVDFTVLSLPTFSNFNYVINVTPYSISPSQFTITSITASSFIISNTTITPGAGFYWTAIGKPA